HRALLGFQNDLAYRLGAPGVPQFQVCEAIQPARVCGEQPYRLWSVVSSNGTTTVPLRIFHQLHEHALIRAFAKNPLTSRHWPLLAIDHISPNLACGQPVVHVAFAGRSRRYLCIVNFQRRRQRSQTGSDRYEFSVLHDAFKSYRQLRAIPRARHIIGYHRANHVGTSANLRAGLQWNVLRHSSGDLVSFLQFLGRDRREQHWQRRACWDGINFVRSICRNPPRSGGDGRYAEKQRRAYCAANEKQARLVKDQPPENGVHTYLLAAVVLAAWSPAQNRAHYSLGCK